MIMNGLMRKFNYEEYYKQLETMPDPIMASKLPKVKLNLKGIRDYARKKVFQLPVFQVPKSNFLLNHDFNASSNRASVLSQENILYNKFVSKNIAYELISLCM